MQKEIALFPLNLAAFPGEQLNLHIFEPRYKQLINDCLQQKTTFGIPSYILNRIEFGTEVEITEVTKYYPDGRLDIKTRGLGVFKVVDFQNPWNQKLYAGGLVKFVKHDENQDSSLNVKIIDLIRELFQWLQVSEEMPVSYSDSMYRFIHKIGLKLEEEYAILSMDNELDRQLYIHRHVENLLPILERAESAKEKIRMNGHFKHLDPLKF